MARRILVLMIWSLLLTAGVVQAQPDAAPVAPNIFLRGLQLADQVRYTASFIKPSDDSVLRNVSVEITLPPDATFTEMLVTRQVQFDVVRKNRQGELTLIWQLSRVEGDVPLDSFSFSLAQPLTSALEFYVQWQAEDGTQFVENFFELPPVLPAIVAEGKVAISQEGFVPVGETGIQVSLPPQAIPVDLTARLLPVDFNPPAEFAGIWWCSLLELVGLPEGTTAEVIVPLRRPLAPFSTLQLFHQQPDGSWIPLENQALVTADGQYVLYTHPGGVVATGGEEGIQPEIKPVESIPIEVVDSPPPANNQPSPPADTSGNPGSGDTAPQAPPVTDGSSNTIIVPESPAQLPPQPTQQIADGSSNTIILGENPTQLPPTQQIADGSSNTIIIAESSPAPAQPTATRSKTDGVTIIGGATPTLIRPLPTQQIADGSSNTIIIGETSPVPQVTATRSKTDGVTIIGGSTPTLLPTLGVFPSPTRSGITDGSSNTILIGEATRTPTLLPTLGIFPSPTQSGITDGSSNTILIGEATRTPTQGIADGASNTILIGAISPTPLPTATRSKTDGVTIIGGSTPTLLPTLGVFPSPTQGIADGSSNTILLGEATRTSTPRPVRQPTATVPPTPAPPLSAQRPLPLGQGGVRVVVLTQPKGLVQCEVGLINCAVIERTAGKGLR